MKLPTPRRQDWTGWVWPVPVTDGRRAVITQEWKPGREPRVGEPSGAKSNHLGVDIAFRKQHGDPAGAVRHLATKAFIAPPGTRIICSGPGKVWGTYRHDYYGLSVLVDHGQVNDHVGGANTFYQHLESYARPWRKGDVVEPGTLMGIMGYAPGDREGFRHLHFELRFPRVGVPQDAWRIDPAPYMRFWEFVEC